MRFLQKQYCLEGSARFNFKGLRDTEGDELKRELFKNELGARSVAQGVGCKALNSKLSFASLQMNCSYSR
jgi:hypothetical protein